MKALRYLLIFVVVLVAAVVAIPFLVPTDVIAEQMAKIARERTGRDLKLGGDASFSFYPDLAVSISDVSLSNPPEMAEGLLLRAGQLRLSLELVPLLTGDIRVKTFELVAPEVNLLTDERGRRNWSFDAAPGDAEAPAPEPSGDGTDLGGLRLDDVRIVDGVVRYLDETVGSAYEGSALNITLSLPEPDGNLDLKGSMVWRGETVDIAGVLGPLDQLDAEKTTNLELEATSTHLKASFEGILSMVDGLGLEGAVDASSPSLRELAAWTGNPLAPGQGLKDFTAKAALDMVDGVIEMRDARFGLDGMQAQGGMTIDTTGARPLIKASLGVDQIDLNRYLPEPSGEAAPGSSPDGGWSDAPIDFSGLNAVDADLRMAASRILYRKVTVDDSQVSVAIKAGRLQARLEKLSLYKGAATGTIALDGSAATPTIVTSFSCQGVSALPLLSDFAGFDWIEGTTKIVLKLSASGTSQKQLVNALNGTVDVLFEDGAIRGINIAQMMRGLGTDILNGWSRSEAQKTDFAALSASYKVTNGIAVNDDLKMIGPLVRMTGAGTIRMPDKWIDYTADPRLVASLKGQGGEADLAGFNVPIKVKGPWAKPDIYPDIAGILDNPAEALKKLKAVGDIDPGKLGLSADQLLGGGSDAVEKVTDTIKETLEGAGDSENGPGALINNILKDLSKPKKAE